MVNIIDVYKTTFTFVLSPVFKWSPAENTIYYQEEYINLNNGSISLLHEIAHALLKHESFEYDIDLVKRESEAWFKTKQLASKHLLDFDDDYADSCLETYRTWIYNRSTCPNCQQTSTEINPQLYRCFNCFDKWSVSRDQTCQIQRRRIS